MEMNSTESNCFNISQKIISPGIFIGEKSSVSEFLSYSVPLLELQIGIILMSAHGLSFVLARFGIPAFISQILAGIILGPTIMGRFNFMKEIVFPSQNTIVLTEIAMFSFLFYIFLTGVEINLESAKRLTRKFAITTGVASILVPLCVAFVIMKVPHYRIKKKSLFYEFVTFIVALCFSSFSGIVRVLKELKIPNSEMGYLLLSAAMISGGISVQVVVACNIFLGHNSSWPRDLCAYIGLLFVLVFLIRPGMNWIIRQIPVGSPVDSSITCGLVMVALICDVYCMMFHQTPGVGVYTFGLIVPVHPPLGSSCLEKFETFSYAVLLPVAIVTSTMMADLTLIFTHFGEIKFYFYIILAIGLTKMFSCLVPLHVFCDIPLVDSVLFATIMTNKGAVEMSLCLIAKEGKLLSDAAYALMIFNILATAFFVSMIVRRMYDPTKNYVFYHERNVRSLKPDSLLRSLICVHDQDHIHSVTRFLDAYRPTREKFLVLHVLHLVPLAGLNTPTFISHNKQNLVSEDSPSHDLIIHFNQYEQRNSKGTSVSTYTSISQISSMNEDISILAFDHVASIIILPFHRKWSCHGEIEADDINIRTINKKMLEKAPCSVAIYFDKGKLGRRKDIALSLGTPLSLCMIFLGGEDDWEALAFAKRMAEDTYSSRLTIIHFMLKNEVDDVELATEKDDGNREDKDGESNDAKALELMLKTYQQNQTSNIRNIEYVKKFVGDGAQTAKEIRSVAYNHDLFIVGRRCGIESRKTSGLSEWIEIPELGIIGDFLASKDVNTRAAVFVVQQQIKFS